MSGSGAAAGPPQGVPVKRMLLAACMTCPLCHRLLRDATTIYECLHTFCRKCIYKKLTDEELECCPICHTDLGCIPVEKLRPDHNLQDLRAKIFPYKRRKLNGAEVVPSITLPVRRKERSLSSLGVNTPRIGTQLGLTGRRTKTLARRASTLHGLRKVIDETIKEEGDNSDGVANSSSPGTLNKITHCRRQTSSNAEICCLTSNKDIKNGPESFMDKFEQWKPLNCLVEAANRTKGLKSSGSSLQTPVIKAEQTNGPVSHMSGTKVQENPIKLKMHNAKNNHVSTSPTMVKARRMHEVSQKRKELVPSAQALLDAANAGCERRICPVWLSLLSDHRKGDAPLPQTPASYLRIKEGNLPVSFIQKYLVKKLNLASEAEVEIACRGELVSPTISLHDLTEKWLRHGPCQRVKASVGTSAKDFVMVLTYRRKIAST